MKRIIFFISILFFSCSAFRTGIKEANVKTDSNVSFVEKDIQFPIEEELFIDFERSLNPNPKIIDNKFLYFTRNGKIFVYDLKEKRGYDSHKFKYGSNVEAVYFQNFVLFSFGAGNDNLVLYDLLEYRSVWEKTIPFGIESKPVFDKTGIYVASLGGTLFKLKQDDGTELWKLKSSKSVHAGLSSLDDSILLSNDAGRSYRIAKSDGKIIWERQSFNSPIYTEALPIGEKILFTNTNGDLYFLSAKTGKLLKNKHFSAAFYGNPAKDNSHFYIGNNNGNFYKFDFDGEEIWRFKANELIHSQALLGLKNVYFGAGDGSFYILDKKTKEKRFERKFKGRFISAPLFWEDKLIVFSDNDDSYLLSTLEKEK